MATLAPPAPVSSITLVWCIRNTTSEANVVGGADWDGDSAKTAAAVAESTRVSTAGSYCGSAPPAIHSKMEQTGPRSGTCASSDYEPRQGRKAAALSRPCAVPQALRIAVGSVLIR